MKLVVGLGNPGNDHRNDRHNVGFALLDRLCLERDVELRESRKFNAMVGIDSGGFRFLKPLTYMNASGDSIKLFVDYYRISPDLILIVHDELDLDAGIVRLKRGGGTGGHNGLRSIEKSLSSNSYCRIRLGIGRPKGNQTVTSYVLSAPDLAAKKAIDSSMEKVVEQMDDLLSGHFDRSMNLLNQRLCP